MSNYSKGIYKDYEMEVLKNEKLEKEYKKALLSAKIAEDEQKRLENIVLKKEQELSLKNQEIDLLTKLNEELKKEVERLKVIQNNDGTTSGIPTSQTPINKKKVIPNFAKNTGDKIGRKKGHKKDKLEKIADEKINEKVEHNIEKCPNCDGDDLKETGNIITKDEKDYNITILNRRHYYKEYRCSCCGKIVHEKIPNYLKEDCQYGS